MEYKKSVLQWYSGTPELKEIRGCVIMLEYADTFDVLSITTQENYEYFFVNTKPLRWAIVNDTYFAKPFLGVYPLVDIEIINGNYHWTILWHKDKYPTAFQCKVHSFYEAVGAWRAFVLSHENSSRSTITKREHRTKK